MSGMSEPLYTTDADGDTVALWPEDMKPADCGHERDSEAVAEAAAVAGPDERAAPGGDA